MDNPPEDVQWVVDQVRGILSDLPDGGIPFYEQPVQLLYGRDVGTPDLYVIWPGYTQMLLVDYKFGFKPVTPCKYNLQIKDYAISLQELYGVESVRAVILQPPYELVDEHIFTADDLADARDRIQGIIARGLDPQAKCVPGPIQCQWCRAAQAGTCPSLQKPALEMPRDLSILDYIGDLEPDQRIGFYDQLSAGNTWFKKALAQIDSQILAGNLEIPGLKVGETAGKRVWADERQALLAIEQLSGDLGKDFKVMDYVALISPSQVEKKLGKSKKAVETMETLTEIPAGNPKVVKDWDAE